MALRRGGEAQRGSRAGEVHERGSRAGKNIGAPTTMDMSSMVVKLVAGATLMDTYYFCHDEEPDNPQLIATLHTGGRMTVQCWTRRRRMMSWSIIGTMRMLAFGIGVSTSVPPIGPSPP